MHTVFSAGIILLITGLSKIISACGHAKILDINDPIFSITFRSLMLAAGGIELGVAGMCLLTTKFRLSLGLVTWIATVFLIYRFGLWFIHWQRPCPCLGNLTDLLHVSPKAAGLLMAAVAIYLFAGSIFYSIATLETRNCNYKTLQP